MQAEFAKVCTQVAAFAGNNRCWNRVALHHLAYYLVRENAELGSQIVCNAIKAAADAYKALQLGRQDTVPTLRFRQTGSVHFDARTYRLVGECVSLYTLGGSQTVAMALGGFQADYLATGKPKEAELVRRGKRWFLISPWIAPIPRLLMKAAHSG